jgi:large subunit ribosomal protein L16
MLQPKRTKFRKMHKGRIHGEAKGGFLTELRSRSP